MTGRSSPGSQTSSSRLASPHSATSVMPSPASARAAAATWGAPPSTTSRFGGYANLRGRPVSGSRPAGAPPASAGRSTPSSPLSIRSSR